MRLYLNSSIKTKITLAMALALPAILAACLVIVGTETCIAKDRLTLRAGVLSEILASCSAQPLSDDAPAADALYTSSQSNELVVLRILNGRTRVRVEVTDNADGILPQNLDDILTFGFTTKQHGHGCGLHSSANEVKQLGGSLTASSDAIGTGATFAVELETQGAYV